MEAGNSREQGRCGDLGPYLDLDLFELSLGGYFSY
jgi:hypothetical protein